MFPELFEIPFVHLTIKSYGLMMVIGFLSCVWLITRLSRDFTPNPQHITNAALYSLVGGVVGARLFFVVHYFDKFRSNPLEVFAIWQGGLELAGGVAVFIIVILFYLRYHKLPIRRYLDVLAIGLMLILVFGRIGCFLNGCCYGKPTELPWGVRFPYNSFAYISQINADPERNRQDPQLILPKEEYLDYLGTNGKWYPKHSEDLTVRQKIEVTEGKYRCLPVHPTQLYSSGIAAFWCLMLYLFWRRAKKAELSGSSGRFFTRPGYTFALMFIVYGITRFLMEYLRDDNPFEFNGLTISQNIGIAMFALGVILMAIFKAMKVKDIEF
ncbi:MAG TPA: prolipoprotein diacylglyceryl transferase [Sedimentisphaerales bacterium]|nr:prolipoprotein diacylglyceryl transferase [Sedimentisphaerales bacterium]